MVLGDADADGRVNGVCSIGNVRFLNTASNAFRIYPGAFQRGFRQQYAKLLSAITSQSISESHYGVQTLCGRTQHFVAGEMAVGVVDELK